MVSGRALAMPVNGNPRASYTVELLKSATNSRAGGMRMALKGAGATSAGGR